MKKYKSSSGSSEGNGGITPTQDAIKQIIKQLQTTVKTAKSQKMAAMTNLNAAKKNYNFNACCYTKAQSSFQKYWEVDNCVTTTVAQDVELMKTNIASFIKDSDDLKKHFKEVVKKIKDAKSKLTDVKDATSKINDCLDTEERCNPSIYDALIEGLSDNDQGQSGLLDALKSITDAAKATQETSCVTFDASIKVSGIQTFSNINSLKSFSDKLVEKVTTLKKNVEDNLKSTTDHSKKAQENLTQSLKDLSIHGDGEFNAVNNFEGRKKTKRHLRNMDCQTVLENEERLEGICEDIKNFAENEGNANTAQQDEEKDMWD